MKRVQQDGQTVEYQTIADMIAALAVIERYLAAPSGATRAQVTYARMSSPWRPYCRW